MLEAYHSSDNPPAVAANSAVATRTWFVPAADCLTVAGSRDARCLSALSLALASLSLLDVSVSLSVCLISVCLFSAPRYYQECCLSPRSRNECTRSFASSSERDAEILTTDERASTYVKCCCATC